MSLDYCFPNRLEEYLLLQDLTRSNPSLAAPWALIGRFLFYRDRHAEAIAAWEHAVALGLLNSTVYRNLGIASFNIRHDAAAAQLAFDQAFQLNQDDARVLYEKDQLAKRVGVAPELRLAELQQHSHLVDRRDDLSVEMPTLLNHTGQPSDALKALRTRRFQPWEAAEASFWANTREPICCSARPRSQKTTQLRRTHFIAALTPPPNLSEARHFLANTSDLYFWISEAEERLENNAAVAQQRGDFQEMAVRPVSELTFYSALALRRLGRSAEADALLQSILAYSQVLDQTPATINYFANSLPTMLLFEEDLAMKNHVIATFLRAQALGGLDRPAEGQEALDEVLRLDRSHAAAVDFRRFVNQPAGAI